MINKEIQTFLDRIGVRGVNFDEFTPLCFVLDGKFSFCIEYSKADDQHLNISVNFEYDLFNEDFLTNAFKSCAYENQRILDYAVSVINDRLMLICSVPVTSTAGNIESTVLNLYELANKLLRENK